MRADTAKDRGSEFLAIVCDRKTAYDLKAEAIDQLRLEPLEMNAESRKRKSFLGDPGNIISRFEVRLRCVLQLGNIAGLQQCQPAVQIGSDLLTLPCRWNIQFPRRAIDVTGHQASLFILALFLNDRMS